MCSHNQAHCTNIESNWPRSGVQYMCHKRCVLSVDTYDVTLIKENLILFGQCLLCNIKDVCYISETFQNDSVVFQLFQVTFLDFFPIRHWHICCKDIIWEALWLWVYIFLNSYTKKVTYLEIHVHDQNAPVHTIPPHPHTHTFFLGVEWGWMYVYS